MTGVEIGIAGLIFSAVGTVTSFLAEKKAAKQAKSQANRANELAAEAEAKQQKIANLSTLRAKRAAAREAQIRRADITSGATTQGANAEGSSAVPGARGSVTSQLTSNLSFLDRTNQFNRQTVALLAEARTVANQPVTVSGLGAGITGVGGTIFDNRAAIAKLF